MMTNGKFALVLVTCTLALTACRVETKTESIPEAEGSGKKAITVRLEPMTRDETKAVINNAIDKSADFATSAREAATSAVNNAERIGKAVTTLSDTMINIHRQPENSDAATTSAP